MNRAGARSRPMVLAAATGCGAGTPTRPWMASRRGKVSVASTLSMSLEPSLTGIELNPARAIASARSACWPRASPDQVGQSTCSAWQPGLAAAICSPSSAIAPVTSALMPSFARPYLPVTDPNVTIRRTLPGRVLPLRTTARAAAASRLSEAVWARTWLCTDAGVSLAMAARGSGPTAWLRAVTLPKRASILRTAAATTAWSAISTSS